MNILTHSEENRQREKIVRLSRSIYDRGLTAGSSGNISVRLDDGWRILAICPPNSQRRPDYILGRSRGVGK